MTAHMIKSLKESTRTQTYFGIELVTLTEIKDICRVEPHKCKVLCFCYPLVMQNT